MDAPGPAEGRAPPPRPRDPLGDAARRGLAPTYEVLNRVQPIGYWPTYLARRTGETGEPVLLSLMPRKGLGAARVNEIARGLATAAGILHPHAVPVVEHGEEESFLWFVTRRETWRPLTTIIKGGGAFAAEELIRLAREATRFLVLLHRQEICHGGLCPGNFLLDRRERLRIANLGADGPLLAHRVSKGKAPGLVGEYAAPEVLDGRRATPRSDQYSLACVLDACAGEACPAVVRTIVGRAAAELPDQRYAHVMDFLEAYVDAWSLAGVGPQQKATSRPPGRATGRVPEVLVPALELGDEEPPRGGHLRSALALVVAGGLGMATLAGAGALPASDDLGLLSMLQERGLRMVDAATAALSGSSSTVRPTTSTAEPTPAGWEDWEYEDPREVLPREGAEEPSPTTAASGSTERSSTRTEPPTRPEREEPAPGSVDADAERSSTTRVPNTSPPTASAERRPAGTTYQPRYEPPAATTPPPPRNGHLFVNAFPWGTVYLDGRPVGNTPLVGLAVEPGRHVLRVEREGFEPFEQPIRVRAGAELYETDIVLRKRPGS